MSELVSVIIVNWNGRHHLELCLPALAQQTAVDFEIIVVDNGSTDDSLDYVNNNHPTVHVMALNENHGFARGNNIGIRAATARFVVLLNNDTKPEPTWLERLLVPAIKDDRIGMVACKMLFYDRPDVINSAGICVDRVGIAWDRLGGQVNQAGSDTPITVFGGSGGAVLYRRRMLAEIGLFDEDYFAYLEDVDLAWRAQLAGWGAVCVETAVVYHHHSASFIEGSPFKSRLLGRNKVWTILKNYPLAALVRYLPLILLYDLGAILVALFLRRDPNPLIGRLMALPKLPTMLGKRIAIQRKQIISNSAMLARMEPVTTPTKVQQRYHHL
jgi:GT2 family glycosyltransferase